MIASRVRTFSVFEDGRHGISWSDCCDREEGSHSGIDERDDSVRRAAMRFMNSLQHGQVITVTEFVRNINGRTNCIGSVSVWYYQQ